MTKQSIPSLRSKSLVAFVALCLAPIALTAQRRNQLLSDDAIGQDIRKRLEHSSPVSIEVSGEPLHALGVLPSFYEQRLYRPAWIHGPSPWPAAAELASMVRQTSRDGLVPDHYHQSAIDHLLARSLSHPEPAVLADLDLLLTDAFLILGAHLVSGRIDPESLDPLWIASRREVDLASALSEAVLDKSPRKVLDSLLPRHEGYARLRHALTRYRHILVEGGWPSVPGGATLRPGDDDPRVLQIRARLAVTESADTTASSRSTFYDQDLEEAVRRFQARHGLGEDGVVGEKTLAAFNVTATERLHQIELNLERWRWLPLHLGESYVLVNIPDFSLTFVESQQPRMSMKVAVGRSYRRTPVFSDRMRYMVLNPYWEVPHKLAVEDKLPEIQKDVTYLSRLGFRLLQGWGADEREVDPTTVDWAELGRGRFPYRLRQNPGPLNALGRIKFMFPNRFNVYLHDTPDHRVFLKSERDVSSGCIRLERPLDLAEVLLGPSSRWNRESLTAATATGKELVVPLERPVAVHLLYWTAWADAAGTVHFRRDVYGRDALLAEALDRAADAARPGEPAIGRAS